MEDRGPECPWNYLEDMTDQEKGNLWKNSSQEGSSSPMEVGNMSATTELAQRPVFSP